MTPILAADIIRRCTRDGHVAWQQVAVQLGQSVDRVRAQHDPTYARAHIWAPTREDPPEMDQPIDETDTHSPHVKPPRLKQRVLALLLKQSMSAATVATMTGTTVGCAKWQLSVMKSEGLVRHSERYPYTWTITIIGNAEHERLRLANGSVRRVTA